MSEGKEEGLLRRLVLFAIFASIQIVVYARMVWNDPG